MSLLTSHNPYFNRWFSAIDENGLTKVRLQSHNPYFNRWFSAMLHLEPMNKEDESQSLF